MTYRPETEHDEAPPALHTCAPPPRFEIPSFTVLDLEAITRAGVERAEDDFPRPVEWQIVSASVGLFRRGTFTLVAKWGDERELVRRALRSVSGSRLLVTFSGRRFDVPVLVAGAMRDRIRFPWAFEREVRSRYGARHVDLCDYLANEGAAPHSGLGAWLTGLGLGGKTAKGSDVAEWYAAGRLREIAEYNAEDVRGTAALFLRTLLVSGRISHEAESEGQTVVREAVAEIGEVTT